MRGQQELTSVRGSHKNFDGLGLHLGLRSQRWDHDGPDLGPLQLPFQEESLCSDRVGGGREVETGKSGLEQPPGEEVRAGAAGGFGRGSHSGTRRYRRHDQ